MSSASVRQRQIKRTPFDSGLTQLYHPRAMGQRDGGSRFGISNLRFWFGFPSAVALCCAIACGIASGCDRSPAGNPPATRATTSPAIVTVASLSPAATDILIGLGAADQLVAVSNFDPARQETKNLPRVGDYQTTDWERLASVHPRVMVTQFGPGRTPPGLRAKADSLHIRLVNVSITRLDDIFGAIKDLADAIDQPARGEQDVHELRARLDAIASTSTGRKIRALIVLDSQAHSVAGRANYLDDLLTIAGGENVIPPGESAYPQIDREMLIKLDPEVIFQLLPDSSAQVLQSANQMWQGLSALQAVRNKQVHIITKTWALSPSQHVADLAQLFADAMARSRN
jgi:ABC-type Fe3+-hydroxamate transport system substrate-binding protein